MGQYLLRRVVLAVPVLLLASLMVFAIIRLIPGDVVTMRLGESGETPEAAEMRRVLGLDRPLWAQYFVWLGNVIRGDLGLSLWTGKPVTQEILLALPITAELALLAIVIALAIGIPAGLLSAVTRESPVDYAVRLVSVAGLAIPPFWLGTMFLMLPAVLAGWAPSSRYVNPAEDPVENLKQFILPALALGYYYAAFSMRMVRSQTLEVLRQDYVRVARAKGLSEAQVVVKHVVKNALIPTITLAGAQLGVLIGGVVVIEQIFSLPGLGRLTLWAISVRDYPQLQANVLLTAVFVIVINLLVDSVYAWLDPRIRLGS
jgi:peptide/nickel transport system permease protein